MARRRRRRAAAPARRRATGGGLVSAPPKRPNRKRKRRAKQRARKQFPGLSGQQRGLIQERGGQDMSMAEYGGQTLMPRAFDAYDQEFDWNALPQGPVQGDFGDWRQEQIDSQYNDYTNRMQSSWDQENNEFEQMAHERGWAPGSDLYNQEKNRIATRQDDARQSALAGAMSGAAQSAGQFYDIGSRDRQNALSEGLQARGMPLSEYNAMNAAQSPMMMQNLGYSQQFGLQQNAQNFTAHQNALARAGAGGGGGPGEPPITPWGQYGFSGPQELDAYREQQRRDSVLWGQQNAPRQPSGPSPWAGAAGGILGSLAGGWASTW